MRRFGIMVVSLDPEFDGAWLGSYEPTTRLDHEARSWGNREGAARYMHNRFAGDPNLHINFRIEELSG